MVENGGNASKAMREAGYSDAMAHNPHKLLQSKGFKELCDELELTDSFIIEALVEDIKAKPRERRGELELAAKMKGLLKKRVEVTSEDGDMSAVAIFGMAHKEIEAMKERGEIC